MKSSVPYAGFDPALSRTSHEVRGLKYSHGGKNTYPQRSHLTRGAWIEILETIKFAVDHLSRTSHEVRGLKSILDVQPGCFSRGRTSHEVRGLKLCMRSEYRLVWRRRTSHEVRGLKL